MLCVITACCHVVPADAVRRAGGGKGQLESPLAKGWTASARGAAIETLPLSFPGSPPKSSRLYTITSSNLGLLNSHYCLKSKWKLYPSANRIHKKAAQPSRLHLLQYCHSKSKSTLLSPKIPNIFSTIRCTYPSLSSQRQEIFLLGTLHVSIYLEVTNS